MSIDSYNERDLRAHCIELATPFSHNINDQIANAQHIYDFICEGCDLIDIADLKKFGIDIEDNTEVGINEETKTSVNTAHAEIAAEAAARAASEIIKSLISDIPLVASAFADRQQEIEEATSAVMESAKELDDLYKLYAEEAALETAKDLDHFTKFETEESKLAALYEEINKIKKAPERKVFHIDVGDLSHEKAKSVIDDLRLNREMEAAEYMRYLGRRLLDGVRIPPSNS